jgi:hypothetical protein
MWLMRFAVSAGRFSFYGSGTGRLTQRRKNETRR